MTESSNQKQQIIDFLSGFTAETTPGSALKIPDFRDYLHAGTVVYITFLPGSDFADTIAVALRLKKEGFTPVPHFAARSIPSRQFFEEKLKRLVEEVGIDQVLAIAGAVNQPVGEYSDSTQLLDTGLFDKYGIKKIGLAGHPEGSPDMSDEAILSALKWKNSFSEKTDAAMYLVTQFCFEAGPIIAWDKMLQAEGNKLPVYIGLPGLATLKSLLAHAKACGIGASVKVLTRQAKNITRLLVVQTPDQQLTDLAAYRAEDPACGIVGVHLYPLGGLRRSALWSYAVVRGEFTLNARGNGFKLDSPID